MAAPEGLNPYAALSPAWEVYKRQLDTAKTEMNRSFREEKRSFQELRRGNALAWRHEAQMNWEVACARALGEGAAIEWMHEKQCIVGGIMMFA